MEAASAETRFRFARPEDFPKIVALIESAYRGESSRAGWTTEADLLDGQRTDLSMLEELDEREDMHFLLLERAGEIIGSVNLERQAELCFLGMFAVRPDLQSQGLGGALLAEAERVAREEWSCHAMMMWVIYLRTDLIAWYERRGYQRTGERSPFPYGDERYGEPRREDLAFECLSKALG